jgi:hypothetical protein
MVARLKETASDGKANARKNSFAGLLRQYCFPNGVIAGFRSPPAFSLRAGLEGGKCGEITGKGRFVGFLSLARFAFVQKALERLP